MYSLKEQVENQKSARLHFCAKKIGFLFDCAPELSRVHGR